MAQAKFVVGINFDMASPNTKYQRSSPGKINDYAESQFLCYDSFPISKLFYSTLSDFTIKSKNLIDLSCYKKSKSPNQEKWFGE